MPWLPSMWRLLGDLRLVPAVLAGVGAAFWVGLLVMAQVDTDESCKTNPSTDCGEFSKGMSILAFGGGAALVALAGAPFALLAWWSHPKAALRRRALAAAAGQQGRSPWWRPPAG